MINFYKKKIRSFIKNYFDDIKIQIANGHFNVVRPQYPNYRQINQSFYKVFSQNGEDGILDYLVEMLSLKDLNFIEIGVGDYTECNTRLLYSLRYCKGLVIDSNENLTFNLQKYESFYKGSIEIINKKINLEDFKEIIIKNNNVDLFSIDIDGIDYWLLNELPYQYSKIMVAEYNPLFGSKYEITVPYDKNFDRTKYHYSNLCYGASIKAIKNLMEKKGFKLIGVNDLKNNAFFLSENEINKINLDIISDNNLEEVCKFNFRESRDKYGLLTYMNKKEAFNLISSCKVYDVNRKSEVTLSELKK